MHTDVPAAAIAGLLQAAAEREADTGRWVSRFARLVDEGLVQIFAPPGTTAAVHVHPYPFGNNWERISEFCQEHLNLFGRSNHRLCVDLSEIETNGFDACLNSLCAVSGTGALMFSVADVHPGLAELLSARQTHQAVTLPLAVRYLAPPQGCAGDPSLWERLVGASHADTGITPVPARAGQLLSGLHASERATTVMPRGLFEAPSDTAWLMLRLDATRLGPPALLRRQLADCLRLADNLIDATVWPRPALHVDALLNRRVAVHVDRVGEWLCRRNLAPDDSQAFVQLRRRLQFVRHCFAHASMLLARRRGPFPQLGAAELIAELAPHYGLGNAERLVRNRCLRHRHILALSPFSILPADIDHTNERVWLDLLPAIGCADIISMAGSERRASLSLAGWERLLHITGALSRARTLITHK